MRAVPVLWPSISTPPDEVEAVKELSAQLCGIAFNVEAWASAHRLYEFAKLFPPGVQRADARQWKFLATHECALQLHHLRERLERIPGFFLRRCPSLVSQVDAQALRAARKKLDEYFPDIDMLRHAIAHAGEIETTPRGMAPEQEFALSGFHQPDVFSAAYKGQIRKLEVSSKSHTRIQEVVAIFLSAFTVAASTLEAQGHLE